MFSLSSLHLVLSSSESLSESLYLLSPTLSLFSLFFLSLSFSFYNPFSLFLSRSFSEYLSLFNSLCLSYCLSLHLLLNLSLSFSFSFWTSLDFSPSVIFLLYDFFLQISTFLNSLFTSNFLFLFSIISLKINLFFSI